jgi:aryl-alcohol dehydrogenase-like predicted oxidoreductase
MSLPTRIYSHQKLSVSLLGFGAGHIGDPALSDKKIHFFLNEILDAGINLIDTARSYGLSEERIGKNLAHRRSEFVLSTKIGYGIAGMADWTAPIILAGVDAALKNLKTNYIDIVHLHSCPLETLQQQDLIEALLQTVEAGKVRIAAYSGENDALEYAIQSGYFSGVQCSVNVFDQRVIDRILPFTSEKDIGFIAKRPLGNAVWRLEERPENQNGESYWVRMKTMGLDFKKKWPEIALRFTAFTPGVDCCITGSSNIENIKKNIQYLEKGPLPEDTCAGIREAFRVNDDDWTGHI